MNPTALQVTGLHLTYGSGDNAVRALRGLDIAVAQGTFCAVMGPSGSGKSSFLNCAAGLDQPESGKIMIDGVDLAGLSDARRTEFRRERLGLVFQSYQLIPYLTVEQNIALPARLGRRRPDRAWIRHLLDRVGLQDRGRRLPSELSGGQQQRVAIARALALRPALILADEPTGALDTVTARTVLTLLREVVDELGQTVVMVTHDPAAAAYADRAAFLVDGCAAGTMTNPTAEAVVAHLAHLEPASAA